MIVENENEYIERGLRILAQIIAREFIKNYVSQITDKNFKK
jgi:hypothetical protein